MPHDKMRACFVELALEVNELVPDGREKSAMLSRLEEALMWGNKAISMERPPES